MTAPYVIQRDEPRDDAEIDVTGLIQVAEKLGGVAASTSNAPLALICPPAWRDVLLEPMRWLATNRIPAGDVTILSGDGGGGKTTVALQLAVAVERGLGDWLGTVCEAGPVIFFSGEEPEAEMRRRLHRVASKRGLVPPISKTCIFTSPTQMPVCSQYPGATARWRRRRFLNRYARPHSTSGPH